MINTQRKKKKEKKHKRCILINIFSLFNVPRSVRFGKFGGRCKSLQCWMISWMRAAMERGVLLMLGWVVVICFKEISLQERKWTPPSSFISGEVRGLCPPAFKWPLASLRSSRTRQLWTKALLKKTPKHLWHSGESQKTDQIFIFPSPKLERAGKPTLLTWAPKLWGTWSSVQSRD